MIFRTSARIISEATIYYEELLRDLGCSEEHCAVIYSEMGSHGVDDPLRQLAEVTHSYSEGPFHVTRTMTSMDAIDHGRIDPTLCGLITIVVRMAHHKDVGFKS